MFLHFPRFAPPAVMSCAAIAALALAGCSPEPEERTFETRTEDMSGGELIVRDADEPGVDVELPATAMTPVAPGPAQPVEGAEMMREGQ